MTGNQSSQYWSQTQPATLVGTVSPDGRYVFTGFEWVLRQSAAPARKSHRGLWIGLGIAGVAAVAAATGALVMSPGFREGFRAGYVATNGWTASDLEDSIRNSAIQLDSGSALGVEDVDCVESDTADWFVCSWRQLGDSTSYIYAIEVSGTQWQSSDALLMGSVSDLTQADVNSLVGGATDGWTPQAGQEQQPAPDFAPGLTADGPDFSEHLYEVFWDDGVTVHTGPRRATASVTWLPEGTVVHVACRTRGDAAPTANGKTTTWWDWIDSPVSGYITDARIDTGGYPPSVPLC